MKFQSLVIAFALILCLGVQSFAQITGNVKLDGKPPVMQVVKALANDPICSKQHKNPVSEESVVTDGDGNLSNVVVSIESAAGQNVPQNVPKTPVVLDQKGCVYIPHVVACMVGQAVTVKSQDICLHNVHTACVNNPPVNIAQSAPGAKKLDPFVAAEDVRIKCDVHPWMNAWIRVLDNPYFAVTDKDGKYSIDTAGLPDGDYTLVFWQETYQERESKVTLKGGKAVADFFYKVPDQAAAK